MKIFGLLNVVFRLVVAAEPQEVLKMKEMARKGKENSDSWAKSAFSARCMSLFLHAINKNEERRIVNNIFGKKFIKREKSASFHVVID